LDELTEDLKEDTREGGL